MFKTVFATTLLTFTLSSSAIANEQGKEKYMTCVGCHGMNGEGGVGPQLAGQTAVNISEKLMKYRNGEQAGPMSSMMIPMAAGLTDEDIQALAEYLSTK
jgi:cytochrome c